MGNVTVAQLESGVKRRKVAWVREIIVLRSARELRLSAAEIARHVVVNSSAIPLHRKGGKEVRRETDKL